MNKVSKSVSKFWERYKSATVAVTKTSIGQRPILPINMEAKNDAHVFEKAEQKDVIQTTKSENKNTVRFPIFTAMPFKTKIKRAVMRKPKPNCPLT